MRLTRVRIALYKRGIRQQELASKVSVSEATISRIANGWKIPDEALKESLAKLLGQRIEYLWPPKRMGKTS